MTENPALTVTSITNGGLTITRRGTCTASAVALVEGYSRRDGRLYGSLDMAVYACAAHWVAAESHWLPADLYGSSEALGEDAAGMTCGRIVDYRGLPDTPGARIA